MVHMREKEQVVSATHCACHEVADEEPMAVKAETCPKVHSVPPTWHRIFNQEGETARNIYAIYVRAQAICQAT
jgi:hypothetical protein